MDYSNWIYEFGKLFTHRKKNLADKTMNQIKGIKDKK